jgi:hypothetical protein
MYKHTCTHGRAAAAVADEKMNCYCWLSDIIVILCLDVLYDLSPELKIKSEASRTKNSPAQQRESSFN